ncbi:hypothetical protein [Pelagibaculum spongiae]|uniref:ABC-type transport auxiliary lipoprotein component domain-containing protein n=1 Tax=Pelagibaculum spongiae TaxID=2080658 RepID=A0A2V1GQR1_9GAMM|nr:hypothetical protein [Pelagibaculum spongiae]PVZ65634.1 hypothetical protein DC094_17255 [Pelagibaculum spongiae]
MKVVKILLAAIVFSSMLGCTMVAPQYQPDFTSINDLKDLELPKMRSGEFKDNNKHVNDISLRGTSLVSPYSNSFAEYLKKALEEDLKQAALWHSPSDIVVTGELLENDVDASGFSTGETDISARFIVLSSGKEVYNKVHKIHYVWDSSFVGAVAIPNAANSYPVGVQKLLKAFFSDRELIATLK